MKYVVTGAAGFIGSHLSEALRRAGHEVLGVDSYTEYYDRARKERNAEGLDVVEADLAEAPLPPLLNGADGIFHLAGQPGVRASWGETFALYVRRNVLATQRVFEAAADGGVRVVFASSSSVYGDAERYPTPEDVAPQPISPYGITKLSCEHLGRAMARARGLDAIALRYFTVYGPRQRPDMAFTTMLEALARGTSFRLFGDGSAARSFTYVDDALAATIAAMERGRTGEIYNVGGGDEATMNEAIALAEEISGRRLDVRKEGAAIGDVRRTRADVTKAEAHLAWSPATPLREGMRAHWEWAVESRA
ncbi:MAG TPA: NAD-dependent epimerase/dehydratase family protein [Gaiellaceae bacterium]|nr:NAD-dependent epimerase/dehydratase family protein [Gaiellaceae bacterium]